MNHIVFDLDGTIADCTHRVHLLPDWDAFYSACFEDIPIGPIVALYKELSESFLYDIHIWTGRRQMEEDKTWMWFDEHRIPIPDRDHWKMRSDGDHRPDTVLKAQWLATVDFVPVLVFEDRTSVVQMYRDKGIQVCQVAPGDF